MSKNKLGYGIVSIAVVLLFVLGWFVADFINYPEQYLTTWKYQLENDVKNGDTEAIECYTTNYLENDKKLFEDEISKSLGTFKVTAYCSCEKCCGEWSDGYTATMTTPTEKRTIAVDESVIPLGTKVIIDGHTYIAEDTGVTIKGKKIDIYFDSHERAMAFGVQYKDVYVY